MSMLTTQLFNVHKFDGFDSSKAASQQGKSDRITLVAGHGGLPAGAGAPGQQQPLPISTLAYSHNSKCHFPYIYYLVVFMQIKFFAWPWRRKINTWSWREQAMAQSSPNRTRS